MNMTNVDEKITKRCGKANPFTTPEGYFDSFTERMMGVIADNDKRAVIAPKKKKSFSIAWGASVAAACVAGVLCFNHFYKVSTAQSSQELASVQITEDDLAIYDETFQKDVLNYAMLDNYDVYDYLSGTTY